MIYFGLVVVARSGHDAGQRTGGFTCGVVVRGCPLLAVDLGWFAAPARPTIGHAEGTAGGYDVARGLVATVTSSGDG
jgi:hypothetical protein